MKIFHNEALIAEYNSNGSRRTWLQRAKITTKRWAKNTFVVGSILAAGYGLGAITNPITTFATVEKIVNVEVEIPLLDKICQAESGGKQFKANGSVTRGLVNPSDIGICQINEPLWNDQARKLGYDIYTEAGNKAMAKWLFVRYGSQPWSASKHIWNK